MNNSDLVSPRAPAPSTSTTAIYTPYYCEENVYNILCSLTSPNPTNQTPAPRIARAYAVLISNLDRRCLLFFQRSSKQGPEQGNYVIWDYHVVVVAVLERGEGEEVVVLDRDSLLGAEVPLREYVDMTFQPNEYGPEGSISPDLRSRFRVVPSALFLANFASDRSHMLVGPDSHEPHPPPTERYYQPPPSYAPLQGEGAKERGESHNLWTKWLDMRLEGDKAEGYEGPLAESGVFGEVLEGPEQLLRRKW